jgi:hypothetical protein
LTAVEAVGEGPSMGKYDPLREHLASLDDRTHVRLTFNEIAALVGALPASAWQHPAWWANEVDGAHVQAHAWLDAGWRVGLVDQRDEWVELDRT